MTDETNDTPEQCQKIDRRDFISGIAVGTASLALLSTTRSLGAQQSMSPAVSAASAADELDSLATDNYPPRASGLRGQHAGSFESAHAARDGGDSQPPPIDPNAERYDLVIVGAGISGLAAAYFFRQALGDDRRILILDNHDDFGGHAKRNEFRHNGRTYLSYGGTMSIETPFPYSYVSKALIADLDIDVSSYPSLEKHDVYRGLGRGIFFDREHFQADRVVAGMGIKSWQQFFAEAPLSESVRSDLTRLHTTSADYMPGLSPQQKAEMLKRMSYQDFLLEHAKLLPASLPFFAGMSFRNHMRVDTCPGYTAARFGAPGFSGMTLPSDPLFHSDYEFHFPDGNASIARLLVSRLVPGVFSEEQTQSSIVTAPARYDLLDRQANATRIRLNSTVVHVEHMGEPSKPTGVRATYVRDGKRHQVVGDNVVMACFNNIIRFILPSLPEPQKQALAYASKVPMQYTNVLVRNWEPWTKLGVSSIHAPNGYHTSAALDIPVSIGAYECPTDPREPVIVHMVRNPNSPGLPRKEQHRRGRSDMLAASFEKIELEVRSQLSRMLGAAGFDAERDVLAVTVNRWPHGYAYTYDTLGDPDLPEAERPHVLGRRAFGRISIANADSGAAAFTNTAIDEAHRAIQDCLSSRGLA